MTEDLTNRVGGASDLLSALASGTHEVDESLASRLGLMSARDGGEPVGSAAAGGGDQGDGGEPVGSAATGGAAGVPEDELVPGGSAQAGAGGTGDGGSGGDGGDSGGGGLLTDADKDTAGRVSGGTLQRDSSEGNDIGPSGGQGSPAK